MVKIYQFRNFLLFSASPPQQTRINAYTLILEKDFRICEREKNIYYTKII